MRSLLWETYRDLLGKHRAATGLSKLEPINADLRSATEAMQVTAAQTGHDLRSRLGVVKLALDMAPGEGLRHVVISALQQMNDIIDQIQWASTVKNPHRIPQALAEAPEAVFDFAAVVRQAVEQAALQAEIKGQTISLSMPERAFGVRGHRALATQIVSNLVENAMHYSPKGGHIGVELTVESDMLVLQVLDNGVGISPGEEERIFRAFVRLSQPTGGESSTGLGLYIVRSSAARLGGQVVARRRDPEQGSVFRVSLPLASSPPAPDRRY